MQFFVIWTLQHKFLSEYAVLKCYCNIQTIMDYKPIPFHVPSACPTYQFNELGGVECREHISVIT